MSVVMAVAFGVSLGWWRGGAFLPELKAYESLYGQKVTLLVTASEDAVYGLGGQLTFGAGEVTLPDGQKLKGRLQVSGFGANAVFTGDRLEVAGKLRPGYGSEQGRMSFARVRVLEHRPTLLAEIRRRFVAGAQTALPEPAGPFIMGLLVGQRDNLPQEVKDDLRQVGLTHIIAVSGANLTIILNACQRLLGDRSKRLSTFLTVSLIGVFLVLAGSSASIVRAAIVSLLGIGAAYYGRTFKPLNLIALAAVITAMANPVYIWSDLGWYLSFLAFFGVLVLSPLVQARWPGKWQQSIIGGVALESICAEVMTLPFVLHIFGQMSRVGLVANLLVVAFIPLAMLLGLFAALAGMLAAPVAGWFAWPATILLTYMLDTARILANLPNVFVEGIGLSLWQMLAFYFMIIATMLFMYFKVKDKSAIITDVSLRKTRGFQT